MRAKVTHPENLRPVATDIPGIHLARTGPAEEFYIDIIGYTNSSALYIKDGFIRKAPFEELSEVGEE